MLDSISSPSVSAPTQDTPIQMLHRLLSFRSACSDAAILRSKSWSKHASLLEEHSVLSQRRRRADQINNSVEHSALDSRPLYCGHMSPKTVSKNQPTPGRILMIVENGNYPGDPRVEI